jgi:hypothetical protein
VHGRFNHFLRLANARIRHTEMNWQVDRMAKGVARQRGEVDQAPIVFFNASTRLRGISLNAAFSLLSAWSLQMQGTPVVQFACGRGMAHCVLGTNRHDIGQAPPCTECMHQSRVLYKHMDVHWFAYHGDVDLKRTIEKLDLDALSKFTYQGVPLGELVLPSTRWILRRHNLNQDDAALEIMRDYILSAWSVKQAFEALVREVKPQSVVVFNGMMYPEATVRWVANQHGIPSFSHEVGMAPFSGFFTAGEATAYPVTIPDDFHLTDAQNEKLDAYLSNRFKGKFTMAGQQFWPEMSGLDDNFLRSADKFKQIIPVFTNVVFDTSQPHANVVFSDMFEWLDMVLEIAKNHMETLFIIRAHPDEARPGKASEESVADWAVRCKVAELTNVTFIRPDEFFSSYEMIRRAKFIMIYNSTIGLEAAIMGKPVLCAGKARYTQLETVFFPNTLPAFRAQAETFLEADQIEVPEAFRENARRFLYFQLYRASLPFGAYIEEDGVWNGYVRLKKFKPADLLPENSPTMQAVHNGLLHQGDFLLTEG